MEIWTNKRGRVVYVDSLVETVNMLGNSPRYVITWRSPSGAGICRGLVRLEDMQPFLRAADEEGLDILDIEQDWGE